MAATSPVPWPCSHVWYCWAQLTGTGAFPGAAAGGPPPLHAVSPAMAAPTAAKAMRFNSCSVPSFPLSRGRIHDVDPVVGRVEGAGREGVTRAVGVDAAAGQRGQR